MSFGAKDTFIYCPDSKDNFFFWGKGQAGSAPNIKYLGSLGSILLFCNSPQGAYRSCFYCPVGAGAQRSGPNAGTLATGIPVSKKFPRF